jgi:hypothetical protein
VTPHVHRNQPIVAGQIRVELTAPAEGALRETVDKENWLAVGVSCLDEVELAASAAGDEVVLHDFLRYGEESTIVPRLT